MTPMFQIFPAHAVRPLIRPDGDGAIFSAVFYRQEEHSLQLIHLPDGRTVEIPLDDACRLGQVYSVRLAPFDGQDWAYRYRSGGSWVVDPHAFGLCDAVIMEDGRKKKVKACSCRALSFNREPVTEKPLPPADWSRQVLYGIHVRGFTASLPEGTPRRGTFAAAAARIPYLKELGVTAVDIMPVYMPLPDRNTKKNYRTMQEALGAWPVGPNGDPLRDLKDRPNYWGYGKGLYYALRPEYGTQEEFAAMVRAFHREGMRVILQFYFEKGLHIPDQVEILRYYFLRYGVDGFRLLGDTSAAPALAGTPSLSDAALFLPSFPFAEIERERESAQILYETDLDSLTAAKLIMPPVGSGERPLTETADPEQDAGALSAQNAYFCKETTGSQDPASGSSGTACPGQSPERSSGMPYSRPGMPSPTGQQAAGPLPAPVDFRNIITCSDDFQTLLRRFVKSDDYVMKDFLKLFLTVPEGHGELRFVTGYEGFTLADLVSYNERHNEANGEFGLDGRADNYSWNCGEEGETSDPDILALRRKQMRNFLTLLMLSQGTPVLWQGDECANSQTGNNNPYCQDNETSWVDWSPAKEKKALTRFTARLAALRQDHPIFCSRRPFQYIDYLGIGHPDISLHGAEAWKPDLGAFSHSIGIAFCENYTEGAAGEHPAGENPAKKRSALKTPSFLYLAVNMYWKELSLALPKLPPHYVWKVFLDTDTEEGFLDDPVTVPDRHCVEMAPRSNRILRAVPDMEEIQRERKEERAQTLPPVGALKKQLRREGGKNRSGIPAGVMRETKNMLAPKDRPLH